MILLNQAKEAHVVEKLLRSSSMTSMHGRTNALRVADTTAAFKRFTGGGGGVDMYEF